MKAKIKVEVAKLISHLTALDKQAVEAHKAEMESFKHESKAYSGKLAEAIANVAKKISSGSLTATQFEKIIHSGCHGKWRTQLGIPEPPEEPSKPRNHKKVIERLKMSAETHITLTEEDFTSYGL